MPVIRVLVGIAYSPVYVIQAVHYARGGEQRQRQNGRASNEALTTVARASESWTVPKTETAVFSFPSQLNRYQPAIRVVSAVACYPASRIVGGFDELARVHMPAVNPMATVAILLGSTRKSAT